MNGYTGTSCGVLETGTRNTFGNGNKRCFDSEEEDDLFSIFINKYKLFRNFGSNTNTKHHLG